MILAPAGRSSRGLCCGSAADVQANIAAEAGVEIPKECFGCGVRLQSLDPDKPGYFQISKKALEELRQQQAQEDAEVLADSETEGVLKAEGCEAQEDAAVEGVLKVEADLSVDGKGGRMVKAALPAADSGDSEELSKVLMGTDPKADKGPSVEDLFNAFDEGLENWGLASPGSEERDAMDYAKLMDKIREDEAEAVVEEGVSSGLRVLCTRCYSLINYGKVKSEAGEAQLPEFDLGKRVGRKIQLQKGRRAIVLCVVDLVDFDGSLPREAIRSLLPVGADEAPMGFRLILVASKVDLLPKVASSRRLQDWVRMRARQGGFPPLASVHLVSSTQQSGVRPLLLDVVRSAGVRGDVWVVGAQNSGKSSLINALRKASRARDRRSLTTAALPGTTLGLVEVKGLPLPEKCRVYDTPGVCHRHQLSAKLPFEEVRMLLPRRRLRPRTYRVGTGHTLLVGGVARLDVLACPSSTLYITLWASDEVTCHMGKTESAEERRAAHGGDRLRPPIGGEGEGEAAREVRLEPCVVELEGSSWKASSEDVHIAGLGWIGVGLVGTAKFRVWAPPGVAVTTRRALMPDYATKFEKPGFSGVAEKGGKEKKQKNKKRT
ncbi:unnamed protein product [Ostreobium quekettii]|uniref:G domain-containing protein n=1 Tax=Ostreobium quekettii TaxID=121088 RepID=A0A8S1ISX0_9CHLO|nr:unnamed protein product [Ostreobium quekettii]